MGEVVVHQSGALILLGRYGSERQAFERANVSFWILRDQGWLYEEPIGSGRDQTNKDYQPTQ
jgi:hypothetical protein